MPIKHLSNVKTSPIRHRNELLDHDVDNVRLEGLRGRHDPVVWLAAQAGERYLVRRDIDFSNMKKFAPELVGVLDE